MKLHYLIISRKAILFRIRIICVSLTSPANTTEDGTWQSHREGGWVTGVTTLGPGPKGGPASFTVFRTKLLLLTFAMVCVQFISFLKCTAIHFERLLKNTRRAEIGTHSAFRRAWYFALNMVCYDSGIWLSSPK